MPSITIEYTIPEEESVSEGFDSVRALLEAAKVDYPNAINWATDPSWQHLGRALTATLGYKIDPDYVEPEPEPEPEPEVEAATFASAPITWFKELLSSDDEEPAAEEESVEEPVAEVAVVEEEPVAAEEPVVEEDSAPVEETAPEEPAVETCQALKGDGEPCHRELPCQYHNDETTSDE